MNTNGTWAKRTHFSMSLSMVGSTSAPTCVLMVLMRLHSCLCPAFQCFRWQTSLRYRRQRQPAHTRMVVALSPAVRPHSAQIKKSLWCSSPSGRAVRGPVELLGACLPLAPFASPSCCNILDDPACSSAEACAIWGGIELLGVGLPLACTASSTRCSTAIGSAASATRSWRISSADGRSTCASSG